VNGEWRVLHGYYEIKAICVLGDIICWLGGRKGIRPVKKTEWWGAGVVICLE